MDSVEGLQEHGACDGAVLHSRPAYEIIDLATINDLLGGFDNRTVIHNTVKDKLLNDPREEWVRQLTRQLGQVYDYDMSTFAFIVQCVAEDAAAGRIRRIDSDENPPATLDIVQTWLECTESPPDEAIANLTAILESDRERVKAKRAALSEAALSELTDAEVHHKLWVAYRKIVCERRRQPVAAESGGYDPIQTDPPYRG